MIGRGVAEPVHGIPEIRGTALIGDVAQHIAALAVLDLVEQLSAELEIISLLVDAEARITDNVDPVLYASDEVVKRRRLRIGLQRNVWNTPSLMIGNSAPMLRTPSSSNPTVDNPPACDRSAMTVIRGLPNRKVPSLSGVTKDVPAKLASQPRARSSSVEWPTDSWIVSQRLVGSSTRSYLPGATGFARSFCWTSCAAKAVSSEAYLEACNAAHEVHAGQGSLLEYGLAAHTQMSRTLFPYLGDPRWHKRRMADALSW